MRIKLLMHLPVDNKHGMTKGRVFEVVNQKPYKGKGHVHWEVMGDAGELVGVLGREAEVLEDEEIEIMEPEKEEAVLFWKRNKQFATQVYAYGETWFKEIARGEIDYEAEVRKLAEQLDVTGYQEKYLIYLV